MVFGSRILPDGSKAIVSPWPIEIPIDQVFLYDRRLTAGTKLDGGEVKKGVA